MSMKTWLSNLFGPREQRALGDGLDWIGGLESTSAGVTVTPDSAMTSSAVYACVRILAETVASLPLSVYRRLERGKERATDHNLYSILHDRPNDFMTSFEYRETLQGHLALWGNAYSEIQYDGRGRVVALWPLRPDKMVKIESAGDQRLFHYMLPSGKVIQINGAQIWHLRGLGGDGLMGYSPIQLMRNAVGLSLATEKYGAKFFSNGARPGGVLQHPGKLSEDAHSRLRSSWNEAHQGLDNAHRVAILEEGMQFNQVGIPPEDAQYLETRRFQIEEIARIYRIPPHMLADLERATFSNVEQLSIEFVTHTIRPWLVRWEQSILANLMTEADRRQYFAEFLVDGLLRGDTSSRYQAYAVARQNGWMSANDIRELENMNPVDGGDVYLVPLNMIPADQVGEMNSTEPAMATETPSEPVSTARSLQADREQRAMRSATARHRMIPAHEALIREAAARVIRREINDVRSAARKMLGQRDFHQFSDWLENFYQDHPEFTIRQMQAVLQAYGETVAAEAQSEVGAAVGMTDEIMKFIQSYVGSLAAQQAGISLYRLRKALEKPDDDLTAVEAELDSWKEQRPAEIAREQSTRFNNAVAKTVYTMSGIMYLRWQTMGDTCPYCRSLNGKRVPIYENFLGAGQELHPEGADVPLSTTTNIGHPPVHAGCDCMIVSSI